MARLDIRDVVIDVDKTIGGTMILTGIYDTFRYVDGIKSDEIVGQTYEVLLPGNSYSTLSVKIPGSRRLNIDLSTGDMMRVQFKDLSLMLYSMNGRSGVAAKASDIIVVNANGKAGTG